MKRQLTAVLVVLLAMTMSIFAQAKTTITFMTPLGGEDGAYMDKIIEEFNQSQSDVEVVHLVVVNSVEYKQKLSTGVTTQSAPEALLIRKFDVPQYLELELFKGFSADDLANVGIDINDVYPNLIEGLEVDGTYYGIPLDVWIFYMAYNKANFSKAGLDPENPPTNLEEFISAMEAIIPNTPEGVTPYYENMHWVWLWTHYMWQFGGELLTPDMTAPAFQEAGAKALHMMLDLQERGITPSAIIDPGPPILAGDSSVLITGVWTLRTWMEQIGEDFGYAVAPQFGDTKAVFGGSHILAVVDAMNQDEAKLNATTTWLKYLWDHAIDWYAAGQTPSRKSIAEGDELKEKLPHIYAVAQQLPHVKMFEMYPYISEVLDEIAVYVESALITHDLSPEEAMEQAAEAVQYIIEDNM